MQALFPEAYAAWFEANPCQNLSTGIGQECSQVCASDLELQAAGPLPDVPTIVLVAAQGDHAGTPYTEEQKERIEEIWLQTNADLAHGQPQGMLDIVDCPTSSSSATPI